MYECLTQDNNRYMNAIRDMSATQWNWDEMSAIRDMSANKNEMSARVIWRYVFNSCEKFGLT